MNNHNFNDIINELYDTHERVAFADAASHFSRADKFDDRADMHIKNLQVNEIPVYYANSVVVLPLVVDKLIALMYRRKAFKYLGSISTKDV